MRQPERNFTVKLVAVFLLAALSIAPVAPAFASTNPDTPTTLHSNVIIGHMSKEGDYAPQYFTFSAGPGTVKLRMTARPNSDGERLYAALQTPDGDQLLQLDTGTSNDRDDTRTGSISLASAQTVVLKVWGAAFFYGKRHPTFRVQIDGDVELDKTAKPVTI
jgi:hypothetical protein